MLTCGVGPRCGSDLALLWLWCGLAATAPIGPLAWKLPYAMGEALKRQKKKRTMTYQKIAKNRVPAQVTPSSVHLISLCRLFRTVLGMACYYLTEKYLSLP